jgi:hypothetical protein
LFPTPPESDNESLLRRKFPESVSDASRIRALAERVASGRYEIDHGAVADTIIERVRLHQQLKAELLQGVAEHGFPPGDSPE